MGLLAAACGGHGDEDAAAPAPGRQSVTAAVVALTETPGTVTASGSVAAWEEVPVGAETGGLVAVAVLVDEGAWVRQGQVLVRLNDALLRAQLSQQDAALASAEALQAQQDAALERARELRERGFLSQAALDGAVANQRTAQAQVAAARAARSETATRLDQTNIRAPVSGLIISRAVTRGQIVQPGVELFRMVRDGRLELNAQAPEADLPLIRAGMSAVVTSAEAGDVSGTVRIVTPEVDPQTRLGVARIALSPGSGLRPGMFARAVIDVGARPGLTIPSAAVVYREGKVGVYLIRAGDVVRFQPVTPGARHGDDLIVTAGLEAGQRVVVRGAGFLGEGDTVSVVAATEPAQTATDAPAAQAAR